MNNKKQPKHTYQFTPDYAVAPGETLAEVLENLSMTQKECAKRCGLTEQSIIRIIKGSQPITYETADRLEMVTGVPSRMWNNLELQYQEQRRKIKQKEAYEQSIHWLNGIPTKELIAQGVLDSSASKADMVGETLRFYGVASVDAWEDVWMDPKVAARRSACFETNIGAASAWIRLGELQAQDIVCAPFNVDCFRTALEEIRKLTISEPALFLPKMKELCAACGVAFVMVKEMKKVPWNGASKWLSPSKAMILVSLRGRAEDLFWFSFFHEAYHILHGEKKRLYIAEERSTDKQEQEADRFAANILIPEAYNKTISQIVSKEDVLAIAKQLGVSSGIVAGRYRHLTGNWSYFKDMIRSFDWDAIK
ncbi:helix-turn-helix domain-containing protein [Sphaerochaeta halotolerans]|uniref:helix-turn-helix domain-containing protein n=1 Tax=Sphaerochaeta halotolerans TaxID=2293840 RepID=UPI00136A0834|nr:helix-turn-helix domain-containing protein [Sphaerochaeta halotolerans]MXI87037.1 helix-turn-helix domain-containing protein [Sphaerochaeta halotolerans]